MILSKVRGLDGVIGRMRRQATRGSIGLERGLKKAGLFLLGQSQRVAPVEFGVLKASGFVRSSGFGNGTNVQIGYTAGYAVYVHENLDAAHGEAFNTKHADKIAAGKMKSRGKNQQAKFLEDPAKNPTNRRMMRAIIAQEVAS